MEMILRAVLRVIAYANIGKPASKCLGAVQARLLLTASSFEAAQRMLKKYVRSKRLDWLAQPFRDLFSSAKENVTQVVQSALKVL